MIATDTTTIRPLTLEELPRCVYSARAFHAEKQLPGKLVPDVFLKNWTTFLTSCTAVILGLFHEDKLVGGIGGMITPDLSDGRIAATEMFWYMLPEHRGGMNAFKLIDAFEAWAHEQGAEEFRMVHMLEPDEDPSTVSLGPIYKRRKYRPLEVAYYKPNPKRSAPCL